MPLWAQAGFLPLGGVLPDSKYSRPSHSAVVHELYCLVQPTSHRPAGEGRQEGYPGVVPFGRPLA